MKLLFSAFLLLPILQSATPILAQSSAPTTAPQQAPFFRDVPPNHWAFAAVQKLASARILEGYPAGNATTMALPTAVKPPRPAPKLSAEAIIMTQLKADLANNIALRGAKVNIDVLPDVNKVMLRGTVRSQSQQQLATAIAKKDAPSFAIINKLQIAR